MQDQKSRGSQVLAFLWIEHTPTTLPCPLRCESLHFLSVIGSGLRGHARQETARPRPSMGLSACGADFQGCGRAPPLQLTSPFSAAAPPLKGRPAYGGAPLVGWRGGGGARRAGVQKTRAEV